MGIKVELADLSLLEKLYLDYISGSEHDNELTYSREIQNETEETAARMKNPEDAERLRTATMAMYCAGEANGFAMGFRYAVKLLEECR